MHPNTTSIYHSQYTNTTNNNSRDVWIENATKMRLMMRNKIELSSMKCEKGRNCIYATRSTIEEKNDFVF